jgi:Rod binding domain-containing protein
MDTDVRPIPTKKFMPLAAAKPGAGVTLKPLDLSHNPRATLGPLDLDRHAPGVMPSGSLAALQGPGRARNANALRVEAEKLVAGTFFGTMLKQMRNSPFRSELFDGGRGGQAFGSMYDQHLAERMARGAGTKLVNQIVRKLEARKAYAKSAVRRDPREADADVDAENRDAAEAKALLNQPRSYAPAA